MSAADPMSEALRQAIRQAYLEGLARQRQGIQEPERQAEAYAEWVIRTLAESEALTGPSR